MSTKTWRRSNSELTLHSPQPVWASAAVCCKTTADRAIGIRQIWPVSWTAGRLRRLAARMVAMKGMSNHTVAPQIPIAT